MSRCAVKRFALWLWRKLPVTLRSCGLFLLVRPFLIRPRGIERCPEDSTLFIAGFFTAATGLGQSARLYYEEARQEYAHVYAIDLTEALLQTPAQGLFAHPLLPLAEVGRYAHKSGTVVLHVNPPICLLALLKLRRLIKNKTLIGYWAWELMDIPLAWKMALTVFDAIQAPSTFTAQAIKRYAKCSVTVHPHAVSILHTADIASGLLPSTTPDEAFIGSSHCASPHLAALAIDQPCAESLFSSAVSAGGHDVQDCFKVLTIFDIRSNLFRKNPQAAVEAFIKAFGDDTRARLYIKTSQTEAFSADFDALKTTIANYPAIELKSEVLDPSALSRLYKSHHAYLSLHRSEGYGLTMHEALLHGLDVVATGWSGNRDFMHGLRSHLVPYSFSGHDSSDPDGLFFSKKGYWAEADTDYAAQVLRELAKKRLPGLQENKASERAYSGCCVFHAPEGCPSPANTVAVTVNYNGEADTLQCLESLYALHEVPRTIIVVDNASSKGSIERLLAAWQKLARENQREVRIITQEVTERPHSLALAHGKEQVGYKTSMQHKNLAERKKDEQSVTEVACEEPAPCLSPYEDILLLMPDNRGFGAANNAAFRLCRSDPVVTGFWLINNDASPMPDALKHLCARLVERPDAGMVSSLLVNEDGTTVQCAGGASINSLTGITKDILRGTMVAECADIIPEYVEIQTDFLNAASLLVRKSFIESIGGFDEEFFMYYEDADLSARGRAKGFKLAFAPHSKVVHQEGASSRRNWRAMQRIAARSRLLFMQKHHPLSYPIAYMRQVTVTGIRSCLSSIAQRVHFLHYKVGE